MPFEKNFTEKTVDLNPFIQFDNWYKEHLTHGLEIPETVSLGTSSEDGRISVRTVLLKEYDQRGFVFFTNYNSRKGSQLFSNPVTAMLFYWPDSGRQVRIEGISHKVSAEESEAYFITRPRESQLSAWASEQSSVIPDREHLVKRFELYKSRFKDSAVEKPDYWGGFRLVPGWFEFWQNGEFRLHDRITYTKRDASWIIERLAP